MTPFLTPEEIAPHTIEDIFLTSLFHVERHEPYESPDKNGHFVCVENNLRIVVAVAPAMKLVIFRGTIRKEANVKDRFLFQPELSNVLMHRFPMIRVVTSEKGMFFEYFLWGNNGISPPMLVAAFRQFSVILKDMLEKIHDFSKSIAVIELSPSGQPLPPGKDFDVSDIDKLMEELMAGDPPAVP